MKNNLIRLSAALIVIAGFCTHVVAQNKDSKKTAKEQNEKKFDDTKLEDDAAFAVEAADIGMFEVKAAELARTNGLSTDVTKFANMMIEDHAKANAELKTYAAKRKITLPVGLSDAMQKKYDELAKLKGLEFDKAYMSEMVSGHRQAISKFEKAADKAKDSELKAWAAAKIPTLKHHLSMAESTEKTVKTYEK